MEIRLEREAAIVETVLFLESEPLDETALARITGLSKDIVEKALEIMVEEYAAPSHGLEPIQSGGGWILAPKAEYWESLKERYGKKNDSRLSRAALETLSIIAYSQPITRAEIEAIRGVSADGMMRFLLEKELIKEVGKKEAPGRPVQYGTTREFLKYFKLGSIAELPRLDELERERFGLDTLAGDSLQAESPAQPESADKTASAAAPGSGQSAEIQAVAIPQDKQEDDADER
jgi:segregation and condensation protein B